MIPPVRTVIVAAVMFLTAICSADSLTIESRVDGGAWTGNTAVEVAAGQAVSLRVASRPGAAIAWYRIIPDIDTRYNNAVWPWLPGAYEWIGFAEINYCRTRLTRFDGKWTIELLPSAPDDGNTVDAGSMKGKYRQESFGSFWYQAEVTLGDRVIRSPGIQDRTDRGLPPGVFRVTIRLANDIRGYLTGFFNVPAVFGSTPYQVRHHLGVDCADVLMAAYSKFHKQPVKTDYNVAMLTRKFPVRVKTEMRDGNPEKTVRWGKDIAPGDFIAVRYFGARQFQHIGMLYSDGNGNGRLDADDIVLHAGPDPLHWSDLRCGMFDGNVVILRPAPLFPPDAS